MAACEHALMRRCAPTGAARARSGNIGPSLASPARATAAGGRPTGGPMLLMIDNYDSFTFNLVQYFGELGEEVRVFRNDEITSKASPS